MSDWDENETEDSFCLETIFSGMKVIEEEKHRGSQLRMSHTV